VAGIGLTDMDRKWVCAPWEEYGGGGGGGGGSYGSYWGGFAASAGVNYNPGFGVGPYEAALGFPMGPYDLDAHGVLWAATYHWIYGTPAYSGYWTTSSFPITGGNDLDGQGGASWWQDFSHAFIHDFSIFKGARQKGQSWSQCVDASQEALLGRGGTYALNAMSGASLFGAAYTTPYVNVEGPVPGTSMGTMSNWEIDTFGNSAAGADGFATASRFTATASEVSGYAFAAAVGIKGGFYISCAH
jgi:hypothetical protein